MFRKRTGILILVCVGLILYINSLSNAFLGDDRSQILNNLQIHNMSNIGNFFLGSTYYNGGLTRLSGLYYRPIMLSCYALLYTLFGPDPFPFHLLQVVIHIASSILVLMLFELFFPITGAFLLALLFLIHPINNEAVVYIANLQDVLFVCIGLGAVVLYMRKGKQQFSTKSLVLSGLLMLLSLFTKETAVAFIAVLFLYSFLFVRKKKFRIYISLIASFCVYLFFRFGLAHIGLTKNQSLAPIALVPLWQRIITMPAIMATYLTTFFFPIRLSSIHFWVVTSIFSPDFYLSLIEDIVFAIAVFTTVWWIRKNHKKLFGQILFFVAWFVCGLLPHMQLIPLDTTVAERWFYFSAIGIIGMLGTIAQCIRIKKNSTKKIIYGILIVIFVFLGIRTFIRNFDWKDGVTLYSGDIKITKPSFLSDNAYATELINAGYYEKAKPFVFRSVRIFPYFANLNNAAIIAFSEKNYPLTKYYLQQALVHSPNYAVYENYANFLVAYANPQEARLFAKTALEKYPNEPRILFDLGKSEFLLGNLPEALTALQKSESINPNEQTEKLIIEIRQKTN